MSPRNVLMGLLLVSTASLAACATPEPPTMKHQCNADAASGYIGKTASADNVEGARKAAGADVARTLSPGQVVTMEYRDGRLNLHVDAARTITRITCG
jgi:uncharacterized lipoprotein YmbA